MSCGQFVAKAHGCPYGTRAEAPKALPVRKFVRIQKHIVNNLNYYRGIAQLVAHLSGGQGVMSSSLVTPTKKERFLNRSF